MTTVLVPLANGCEELEAVTVIDLLRRADISVCTASLQDKHVKASRGVTLVADYTLDQVIHDKFDALVLPSGLPGADHLNEDPRIHQLITQTYHHGGLIVAICAAPKVLVTNGITDGKIITCYPCAIEPSNYQKKS
jgi:4-methyl-5(b-hydroxyethyl)-thiazole monophosphate biosynthesis